ncbi:MAG: hypothetical protein IPM57_03835 [Oligoflexia bacterium]|nr:hypothetical protein [Oligoflexia bacterium]
MIKKEFKIGPEEINTYLSGVKFILPLLLKKYCLLLLLYFFIFFSTYYIQLYLYGNLLKFHFQMIKIVSILLVIVSIFETIRNLMLLLPLFVFYRFILSESGIKIVDKSNNLIIHISYEAVQYIQFCDNFFWLTPQFIKKNNMKWVLVRYKSIINEDRFSKIILLGLHSNDETLQIEKYVKEVKPTIKVIHGSINNPLAFN